MIWYILLSIAGLLIGILGVVLFTPWGLHATFLHKESTTLFSALAYWIHPAVIRANYDYEKGSVDVLLFGKIINKKKDDSVSVSSDDTIKSGSISGVEIKNNSEHLPQETETVIKNKNSKAKPNKGGVVAEKNISDESGSKDKHQGDKKSVRGDKHKDNKKSVPGDKHRSKDRGSQKTKVTLVERIRRNPFVFFAEKRSLRHKCYVWVKRIVKSTFKILRIELFDIRAGISFEDPSVSGKIYGYVEGARHALSLYSKKINLQYRPIFVNGQNTIEGEVKIVTSIAKMVSPVFIAVVMFPYYTFAITWWNYRHFLKKGLHEKCDR
jgi:hypothetical protein